MLCVDVCLDEILCNGRQLLCQCAHLPAVCLRCLQPSPFAAPVTVATLSFRRSCFGLFLFPLAGVGAGPFPREKLLRLRPLLLSLLFLLPPPPGG